ELTPINSINCLSFSEVLPSEFLKEKTVHVFPDILVVLFSFQGANFNVASFLRPDKYITQVKTLSIINFILHLFESTTFYRGQLLYHFYLHSVNIPFTFYQHKQTFF
ncbi:hypothetical protein CIL03_09425, partial [Virgibacillus indicus]